MSATVTIPTRTHPIARLIGGVKKDLRPERASARITQRRRVFTAQAIPVSPPFARQKHLSRCARLQAAATATRSRLTQNP
jgi:hypothetical protein